MLDCQSQPCVKVESSEEASRRLRRLSLFGLVLLTMFVAVAARRQQDAPPPVSFRIVVGLKDKEPAEWNGKIEAAGGEVTSLSGWRFEDTDAVDGTKGWTCQTRNNIAPEKRYPVQDFAGKPKFKPDLVPWPNGVQMTVQGKTPAVTVRFRQGTIKFAVNDILTGEPKTFLDGQVRVERLPDTTLVRPAADFKKKKDGAVQDDCPALWIDPKSGKQYLAWAAYQNAKTRVLLAQRDGPDAKWSEPLDVAGPGDHFRVAVSGTKDGGVWIVWSTQANQRWQLEGRYLKGNKLGETALVDGAFLPPCTWHRMTTDREGRAWVVWQRALSGVFAVCTDGPTWPQSGVLVGGNLDGKASPRGWDPVVVADPKEDRVWVGWDEYEGDNYRVCVRSISGGIAYNLGKTQYPEAAPLFQAHVSLACDKHGRLWAAWDEAGPQWGKDTGFLYERGEGANNASRLYASRDIRVRCLVDGKWQDPAADLRTVLPPDLREYNDYPQLQCDQDSRVWLAFRHRTCRRPRFDGWAAQGRWDVYATAFLGDRWLTPVELPLSGGRNDMRIASAKDDAGKVYFAYASDNRLWALQGMPPRNHHVAVSRLGSAPKPGEFKFVIRERKYPNVKPVHPKEAEQVARIRNYEIKTGGNKYKIYRGDLHRHTDISGDGPGDGSLMDLHRYAIDAAALDFVLVADHNMGQDNEYCWWRTQQANDLYTLPTKFISMYGYERSVKYPNGHRNVIWTERGHRTLPIPAKPLPAALKGDTARLYDYLRKTGGICTLHTSASDQGTNWEDPHDPTLEPFVELFQGYHTSYEALGAPKAIDDKTDIIHGPYKADGFVNLALKKGYKLGFQSSSDHISTHVSYACILAEEFSRKGLVDAMKKRHTYAATDNIVLDVRLGNNLMGDEVRTEQVRFDVVVLGTAPLDSVEILRNGDVVHTERGKAVEARFQWEDKNPPRGDKASYYYVRVQQKDGNMAWSSPIWVTVARKSST